ncbi:SMP-30/gluconolactonase/LRE family protein [Bogoriella caseilytica]|uniref:Sugar lactone lactonase YvrE n=1 Tax=Bogoriella caseilytica TaxID=56055 RepID=A0A3N2BB09_9MICO|nr:SMP-30/gluconolactonase/LRE family protein [Bogoriella caseilytica]ROR72441.1 sugar lactone lactonase YvrE [Bogoriella caseilytica]
MSIDTPEQLTDPLCYHGEGPVWAEEWGGLRWVDMLAGDLLTLKADGSVDRLSTGSKVAAFVRPRSTGGYVVGLERGIGLADGPFDAPTPWVELFEDPNLRMNEGGCDPFGNVYGGNMAYDRTPEIGHLWRLTATGEVTEVLDQVTTSNGIDFSPDGTRAYYNDTHTGGTDVFEVGENGELLNRQVFHSADDGRADGLTVDSAGNVWVALNKVGRVRLYSPEATILADIDLPVRLVTACTLGGADGRDLFITTSREKLEDPEPEAGAVFRLRVDTPGKPVLPFGG